MGGDGPRIGIHQVIKAVPLPGVGNPPNGSCVLSPEVGEEAWKQDLKTVFSMLGKVTEAPEEKLKVFQTASAMMGPFFQHCHFVQQWMIEKEVDKTLAEDYLCGFFNSLGAEMASHGGQGGEK